MSHRVHSAPAKFKLFFPGLFDVQVESDFEKREGEELEISVLPEEFAGKEISDKLRQLHRAVELASSGDVEEIKPIFGWQVIPWHKDKNIETAHGPKYKWISAIRLVKDKHEVWYINESEYENVGCETPSFFAFDQQSIEALKKDIGGKIETDTTIESWF